MLSHIQLFVALWTAARQAPLSIKHQCSPAISINMTNSEWLTAVSGIPVNHASQYLHPVRDHPHWGWAGPWDQLWPAGHLGRVMQWKRCLRVPWTARRSNQSILKEISPEYSWKDWHWSWSSNALATWCEKPTHWKRPWCWERLRVKEEAGSRGCDGGMASPMQWAWIWANSRKQWRKEEPGEPQSTGLQTVGHDPVTEQHPDIQAQEEAEENSPLASPCDPCELPTFLTVFQLWF